MNPERPNIEELDRLWEEATPGEWLKPFDDGAVAKPNGRESLLMLDVGGMAVFESPSDAAFIVAAHNAYPALSAYVKALEKERDGLLICNEQLSERLQEKSGETGRYFR
jgi:hypothetical protein